MNTDKISKFKVAKVPYTIIPNNILKENDLTFEEKGLLCSLLSMPPKWEIMKNDLYTRYKDKKSTIDRVFKSLQEKGYIHSSRESDENGRFKGWSHYVYYEPQAAIREQESPTSGIPEVGQTTPILNKDSNRKEKRNIYIGSDEDFFMQFWNAYGKKEDELATRQEWKRLSEEEKNLAATNAAKFVELKKLNKIIIPKPSTYLRYKRFNDEIDELPAAKKTSSPKLVSKHKTLRDPKITLDMYDYYYKHRDNPQMLFSVCETEYDYLAKCEMYCFEPQLDNFRKYKHESGK